jgi:putative cell wall-binding protein
MGTKNAWRVQGMKKWKKWLSIMMTAAMVLGGQSLGAIGVSADANTITVTTKAELEAIAAAVNNGTNDYSGKTILLGADIDFNNAKWTPIGVGHFTSIDASILSTDPNHAFKGIFDGQNHTISNFMVVPTVEETAANSSSSLKHQKVSPSNDYDHNISVNNHSKGFFGFVDGGTIKNLKVDEASITGWNAEAAVVGTMGSGKISNITVTNSSINGSYENAGAIVGQQAGDNFTIENCHVYNCHISLPTENEYENGAGALVGRTEGGNPVITGNLVYGCIIQAYRKAAGLIGYLLQPTAITMNNNDISATDVSINTNLPKNKVSSPYFGILFAEIQGNPNSLRAYEASSSSTYGFSYTEGATAANCYTGSISIPSSVDTSISKNMLTISQVWQSTNGSVAQLDSGNQFSDFRFAVECANNGDIVTLLKDCTLDQMILLRKNLKVILAGHSITRSNGKTAFQVINNSTLTIDGTAKGSKITGTLAAGMATNNNGNLVINGGTYLASVTNDCEIQTNGTCSSCNVTATNATFSSTDDTFYLAGAGEYKLKDCNITGNTGIYMKSGNLTLDGSTISANGASVEPKANGDGANSTGDGIILDAKSGYKGNMNLTLKSNCNVSSVNGYAIRETYTDATETATHSINIQDGYYSSSKNNISVSTYFTKAVATRASTLAVTGGYFTSDPSDFLVSPKIAIAGSYPFFGKNYLFNVAEKTNAAVVIKPAPAEIETTSIANTNVDDEAAAALQATSTEASGLTSAAGSTAQKTNESAESAAEAINNLNNTAGATAGNVKIYVQPYLDIKITDAAGASESGTATLTLSITPMVKTVASTAADASGINQTNSAVLEKETKLTITTPVTIKLPIPQALAIEDVNVSTGYKPLTIKHLKEDGRIYYYDSAVTREGNGTSESPYHFYSTFTVTHGFSDFTLMAEDTRTLSVTYDATSGATASATAGSYKVTNINDNLPTAAKSGYTFSGWKFTDIDGNYKTLTNELWETLWTNATGTSISVNASAVFTADSNPSTPTTYKVSFDANGGTGTMDAVSVTSGSDASLPEMGFTYTGHNFLTWNTAKDGSGASYRNGGKVAAVKADVTLYAQWVKAPTSDGKLTGFPGDSRYETMEMLVDTNDYDAGGSVVIANGEGYADALAAAGFAGLKKAPIILTEKDSLSNEARALIQALIPTSVYIAGGETAVTPEVVDAVKAIVPNASFKRFDGVDRFDTAMKIYAEGGTAWSKQAIIVDGENYADALSIAPYAYASGSPIFLSSEKSALNDAALKAINGGAFTNAIIAGGENAVPESVDGSDIKIPSTRFNGKDRYDTCSEFDAWAVGASNDAIQPLLKMTYTRPAVSTGIGFADALAGSAYCGSNNSVLLLADEGNLECIEKNLKDNASSVVKVSIFGGTNAVPDTVRAAVKAAIG